MKLGISCYPTVGGSGILATRLGIALAHRGHEVHFITYEAPFLLQDRDYKNVYVHLVDVVEYPLFNYVPYTVALGSQMIDVVKEAELDLLHVHYAIPQSTSAFLVKKAQGVPYIVTLHGSDVSILGVDAAYLNVTRLSLREADKVTATSNFLIDKAKKQMKLQREIVKIPNFVDSNLFRPLKKSEERGEIETVITHISNFRPVKRVQDLVRAMKIVVKKTEDCKLVLVGDGPERPAVAALIERFKLRGKVTLTGFRRDIPRILNYSDVLVIPSEMESAPLTLLEGMSCSVPVVAAKVGGVPEIVEDGVNGFLVAPRKPKQIAEKILTLHENPALREKLGKAGRNMVLEKYSKKRVVSLYEDLYESVAFKR